MSFWVAGRDIRVVKDGEMKEKEVYYSRGISSNPRGDLE